MIEIVIFQIEYQTSLVTFPVCIKYSMRENL